MQKTLRLSLSLHSVQRAATLILLVSVINCLSFLSRSSASSVPAKSGSAPASVDRGKRDEDEGKNRCKKCAQVGDQSIYVPLVRLPEAQGGELVFNSRSSKELPVTSIFYKRDGSPVVGKTINVRSGEIRYADVKSLLPGRGVMRMTGAGCL
jgi:hypothetical protein